MVTVSSAFMSSRRERISFSVASASGAALNCDALGVIASGVGTGAVLVDADREAFAATDFGKADVDNTEVVRDLSFHCIAGADSRRPQAILKQFPAKWNPGRLECAVEAAAPSRKSHTSDVGSAAPRVQQTRPSCLPASIGVPQRSRGHRRFQSG